jgi:hypothetical protein
MPRRNFPLSDALQMSVADEHQPDKKPTMRHAGSTVAALHYFTAATVM